MLSDELKVSLAASNSYHKYCELLKSYQKSICNLSRDTIETFTLTLSASTEALAKALIRLTSLVDSSLSSLTSRGTDSDNPDVLIDTFKVYRTLLKTRFVLEHCLISRPDIVSIKELLGEDETSGSPIKEFIQSVVNVALVSIDPLIGV